MHAYKSKIVGDTLADRQIAILCTPTRNQAIACLLVIVNVPFQHKYSYIIDETSGVDSYPYPVNEGQRYIKLNPGRSYV